jgi:hypothetical protein
MSILTYKRHTDPFLNRKIYYIATYTADVSLRLTSRLHLLLVPLNTILILIHNLLGDHNHLLRHYPYPYFLRLHANVAITHGESLLILIKMLCFTATNS